MLVDDRVKDVMSPMVKPCRIRCCPDKSLFAGGNDLLIPTESQARQGRTLTDNIYHPSAGLISFNERHPSSGLLNNALSRFRCCEPDSVLVRELPTNRALGRIFRRQNRPCCIWRRVGLAVKQ